MLNKILTARVSRPALIRYAAVLLVAGVCAIGATANAQQNGDLRASLNELLFKAILAGDINAVRTIVEAGADLSRPNMRGKTAMDVAIGGGKFDIAQYLVLARRLEQRRSNLTEFTAKQNEPDLASRKVTVNAAIRAARHIHLRNSDVTDLGLQDCNAVKVRVSGEKGVTYDNVRLKIDDSYLPELHLDTDDANAADLVCGNTAYILA